MKLCATGRRLLALILAAGACLFLCTPYALGAEGTFVPVTQAEQILEGGSFVLVAAYSAGEETVYYAPGTGLDRKLDAVPVNAETPEPEIPVWTVQAFGDGISLFNGSEYLTYDAETYFGSSQEPYTWLLTEGENGAFRLSASAEGPVIGYNHNGGNGRFGVYSLSEAWDSQYRFDLLIYKFGSAEEPEPVPLPQASQVTVSPDGGELYPAGGGAVTLNTNTPGGEIYYATSPDGETYSEYTLYTQPILPEAGFGTLWLKAYAAGAGYENSREVICKFTERTGYYDFYFGQLHAHTAASDGLGTVEEAFSYAAQVEDLDFLAVTDHSNSFDNDTLGALSQDGTAVSRKWQAGKAAAAAVTNSGFVGLYGFEMTWNNGLGHISTFGTPGWASRNQAEYQDLGTALENYYAALASVPGSVSQFNHPGVIHGDFEDFSHYSPEADKRIALIEVFNSDVGDSYDAYIRALDLGWHLAPTCNQDNHSGQWGSQDSGRTVVLANTLTEANLLDAMANYRVYATRDSDLEIQFTLDGNLMGSRLFDYGEEVTIQVSLSDATDGNAAALEVIGSCGAVAAAQAINGPVSLTLPSNSSYYFLRVIQPDGDVAVTAPVWLEKEPPLEITQLEADGGIITSGEAQNFTVEITNRYFSALSGVTVMVTDASGQVLVSDIIDNLSGGSGTRWTFLHTFAQDGITTLTVTVTAGERTISRELTVTVMPRNIISDVIVDGTHGASVAAENLTAVAVDAGFKAHVEMHQITAAQLEHCSVLIVPAPGVAFEPEFTALVADFAAGGGNVLLCGASDGSKPGTAERMNALLAVIGSTMTLSDDTVYDPANNGGMPDILFAETINTDTPWTKGIREGQVYSHRSGCSVNPGSGTWLVQGFADTFSVDGDFNGLECSGETYREILLDDSDGPKEILYDIVKSSGGVCLMAAEEISGGRVFLSGGFPFGESMQYEMENLWDLPYANRTVFENILGIPVKLPQVTPISQVRNAEAGRIFLIEGYVTAGTENPHNRLPDTIYVQDDTGGIAAVPYSETGLALGTKVWITGAVSRVHGDIQLEILHLSVSEAPGKGIGPAAMDGETAMDYASSGGLLVEVEGTVTQVTRTADGFGVAGFTLVDSRGTEARILIEDTIRSGTTGLNDLARTVCAGNRVSVAGLVYHLDETLLRVRDCDEVVLLWAPGTGTNPPTADTFPLEGLLTCMAVCLLAGIALIWKNRYKKGLQ